MKRLVFFILVIGFLTGVFRQARAEDADPEIGAIHAVAEAYISFEPARLRDAFLPSMNLYTTDEKGSLRTIPFSEFLQRVSSNANAPHEESHASTDMVEHTGNVAVVKVTTARPRTTVTDYLSLVRIENHWKIVNKVFYVEPRNSSASSQEAPKSP